jgi:transcriptional regulator with PAS, ATPase and Fis domain
MPAALQAKLLRFVQEREVQPLGSSRGKKVDVRILAATNRDLEKEIAAGRFREDLFYRLNVVSVEIPPLRGRREDIPPLAAHFLEIFGRRHQREVRGITGEGMDLLLAHPWPGNVRELENTIERAVVLGRDAMLTPGDLFPSGQPAEVPPRPPAAAGRTLKEAEVEIIRQTLERTGGNRTRAAKELGISRQTLLNKLREAGE